MDEILGRDFSGLTNYGKPVEHSQLSKEAHFEKITAELVRKYSDLICQIQELELKYALLVNQLGRHGIVVPKLPEEKEVY